jgi:hypothetical protein
MPKLSSLVIVILVVASLVLSACQSSGPVPTITSIPTSNIPTPLPAATPAPQHPKALPEAIRLDYSTTTMSVSPGDLEPGKAIQVVFKAEAGRKIIVKTVIESGSRGTLSLWGADGAILVPEVAGITEWEGVLPSAQDYYLNLKNTAQDKLVYQLTIKMPPLAQPEAKRIQFQPGTTGGTTQGEVPAKGIIRYVLGAASGQQMTVTLTTAAASVDAYLYVWSADGTVYTLAAPVKEWSGLLPSTQDYFVEIISVTDQPVPYKLSINIPPAPTPKAVPTSAKTETAKIAKDQVIRFDTGPMNFSVDGAVLSGERDRYTFSAKPGETLDVMISSMESNAVFTILGPDNKPLAGTEEGKNAANFSVRVMQDGTYHILVGPTRGNAAYTLTVKIAG